MGDQLKTPLNLNISVARACFVRCRGCYNHFGRTSHLLSSELLLAFLGSAYDAGMRKVTLCGGDPLSRPDIPDLLARIKGLGFTANLDTVGTPLLGPTRAIFYGHADVPTVDAVQLAELVSLIGIPLDGASEASVATFRQGRHRLFEEQLEILEILSRVGAAICVNTVVHRHNLADLSAISSHLTGLRTLVKWQLFQFMPTGPLGYRNRHQFEIAAGVFEEACAALLEQSGAGLVSRIECKSNAARKGRYLLVDSQGLAWMPRYSYGSGWSPESDPTDERVVLGDLNTPGDHERILRVALEPQDFLPHLLGDTATADVSPDSPVPSPSRADVSF